MGKAAPGVFYSLQGEVRQISSLFLQVILLLYHEKLSGRNVPSVPILKVTLGEFGCVWRWERVIA